MNVVNKMLKISKDDLALTEGTKKLTLGSLAFPIFLENVSVQLISMIYSVLLARYESGIFVSPINKATSIISIYTVLNSMIKTGVSVWLSVKLGEKDESGCKRIIGSSLTSYFIISLMFGVIFAAFASPLLGMYGITKTSPDFDVAYKYLIGRIVCIALFSSGTLFAAILRCYGYPGIGAICILVSNAINVIALFLGFNVFAISREHSITLLISSAAAADIIGFIMYVAAMRIKKISIPIVFDFSWFKKLLRIGFPSSIADISYTLSVALTTVITAKLADDVFNLKVYISNVVYFGHAWGTALAMANAIFVGRHLGMRNYAAIKKIHTQVLRKVLLYNIFFSVVTLLVSKPFMKYVYHVDDSLLTCAFIVFALDILVEIGRGINNVYQQGGLAPVGDTVYTTVISIINCWLTVLIAAICVFALNLGIYGIWLSFIFSEFSKAIFFVMRWHRDGWKNKLLN